MVVDDEPLAIKILENYIAQLPHELELVATARNGLEAFELLQQHPVDLLFLDIQMPQLTGLELIKSIETQTKVVFTTAYRDYAVESYELNAFDYLLKPVALERFLKVIEKCKQARPTSPVRQESIAHEPFVFFKSDKKVFKVNVKHILYVESFKDFVVIHTTSEQIQTYQGISQIEQLLPEDAFLRIHRSFIVALEHIHSFSATAVQIGSVELPIGRTYKAQVSARLGLDKLFPS